jgi:ComF family protein
LACRDPLTDPEQSLCVECRCALPWLNSLRCARCGLRSPCSPCPARQAAFAVSWAPLAHSGSAKAIVQALKFRGALPLADLMAAQIAAGAPHELLDVEGVLVPVPAHPSRARARGFDHAALLAAALSRRTGLPVADCLRRGGDPTRQLGARRRERLASGRIAVAARGQVPARPVLVDDVHTTGATLDACARALRAAGARRVVALTYSRTL